MFRIWDKKASYTIVMSRKSSSKWYQNVHNSLYLNVGTSVLSFKPECHNHLAFC